MGGVSSSGSWGFSSVGSWVGMSTGALVGSWVGTSTGASVGSLLVLGRSSGGGGLSLGGAFDPPSACLGWSPVLPLDLLAPSCQSGHSWLSLVSSPGHPQTAALPHLQCRRTLL